MSELYFRLGEAEGFTSKKLADKRDGFANPIRELLQNSLDASKEASNEKCKISIYIETLDVTDIPHIDDYKNTLKQAIQYHKREGSYKQNAKQTVNFIRAALREDSVKVLMFVDNGIGLSPAALNGLIGERSVKSNESSGGSFGVGHLSSYFLSALRYVLYASKYKQSDATKTLFSGSPILAGFEDDNSTRGSIGRIVEKTPDNELKPNYDFPANFPSFIQPKMGEIETGSMVAILGLNTDWNNEAYYAIVSNFFYAIYHQELTIDIDNQGVSISIDYADIERILSKQKDGKNASGDKILSNQHAYQTWLSVQDETCKQMIELSNQDKICIHIRNNIETDSVIALIRNGMLIARHDKMLSNEMNNLRKNSDFEPFSIVINVDETTCPELFTLVKGAENPYHNRLERARLMPAKEKQLKKLFKELSGFIKTHLTKKDRESFNLSLPLLEIPDKAEANGKGENASRPSSQTAKAKPKINKPKPPVGRIKITKNGKKRPAPVLINRVLEATNLVKMKDDGDTIRLELAITPHNIDAKDEVYLSVSLAQDTDNDATDSALDFISITKNGKNILPDLYEVEEDGVIEKIAPDKTQIKLGRLSASKTHYISAVIQKPDKVKNIGVALKPFLGLKQNRGTK